MQHHIHLKKKKKSGKLFARFFVGLVTAAVLLACLLVARLIIAPIDLEFGKQEIESQVADLLPGWTVSYQKATLGWDWQAVRPWVIIEDLRLVDRRDRLVANIPIVEVGTSFSTLYGQIKVSSVAVRGANVDILNIGAFSDDESSDTFPELFGETGVPHINILKPLTEAFNRFSKRLIAEAPKFQQLQILNTNVSVYRGPDIDVARLAVPSLTLEKVGDEVTASSTVDVALGGVPTRVNVGAKLLPEDEELDLTLGFAELVPKDLVDYLQLSEFFTAFDFPLSLQINLTLGVGEGLEQADFIAHIDKGELYHASLFPERAQIEYGNISAHYDPGEQIFVFDQIEASLGGPLVEGSGIIYWLDGEATPGIRLTASVENATIPQVLSFWPVARKPDGTEKGGRAWVSKHMIGGAAKKARFDFDLPPDGQSTFKSGSLYELSFIFDDIDTHFIRSMPPVRGAQGRAFLTEEILSISIDKGTLVGLPVTNVKAHLSNINSRDTSYGDFTFNLGGGIQEILELIDNPPLRIPQKIKLDIARFDGSANVTAHIGTPLLIKPGEDKLTYDVKADLLDLSVDDILDGEGIRSGVAQMHITPKAIDASGTARLNGVLTDFTWQEDLVGGRDNPDLQTTIISAKGTTDQNGLNAIKVAASDYIDGKVDFDVVLKGRNFAFSEIDFKAKADASKLMITELGWSKAPDVPALIEGKVRFEENIVHIKPFEITGDKIDASGDFRWTNGDLEAQFTARQLGENSLKADLSIPVNDKSRVVVTASTLDLRPFLNGVDSVEREVLEDLGPDLTKTVASNLKVEPVDDNAILDLTVKADELILLNGEHINNLDFTGQIISGEPYQLSATGTLSKTMSTISLNLTPDTQTRNTPTPQKLTLKSDDGGAIMRGLGIFPHLNGGDLNLDVTSMGWERTWRMEGTAKVDNAVLVNKATLGKEVTEGLIEGIEEYVDDAGLSLDVVDVPFIYDRGLLDLNGLKANGGSIGMTMEGQLHTQSGKINMNGVIVPAYGLNSLLGKIPLIGGIFSGGEGKGLFGFTYRIKGATDNPNVEVSALSGIAPGFLRGIFEGSKGKVEDVVLPEEEKTEEAPKVKNEKSSGNEKMSGGTK